MRMIVAIGMCLFCSTGLAQETPDHETLSHEGSEELTRLKGLVGTWTGQVDHGNGPEDMTVVYRVTAGGSAVVETFNPDTPMEMVTVYHDRDGKLEMTHYCMLGNQPRMRLTKSGKKSVSLELVDDSGIAEDETCMSAVTIEFASAEKIIQHWSMNMAGERTAGPAIELTRQPKGTEAKHTEARGAKAK